MRRCSSSPWPAGPTYQLAFNAAAIEGSERRLVRYRVVRMMDGPDEIRSQEVGQLEVWCQSRDGKERFLPVWAALSYLLLGFGFGVRHLDDWWQICGWGVVAVAVTDLAQRVRWLRRRRLR